MGPRTKSVVLVFMFWKKGPKVCALFKLVTLVATELPLNAFFVPSVKLLMPIPAQSLK